MTMPLAIVCDDCATQALLLTRMLAALGYRVQILAFDQLTLPLAGVPAVVCVELFGANRNGFKQLRHWCRHHECALLLVSASGRRTDDAWGVLAGATAVLQRPFSAAQLAECLPPVCPA